MTNVTTHTSKPEHKTLELANTRASSHDSCPREDPVSNWILLRDGDPVQLYSDGTLVAEGKADGVAFNGQFLWIVEDHGRGRRLIGADDGISVTRYLPYGSPNRPRR